MPKVKLDPAARKPRAASLPVRNHYWRAQPQKTVRAKACKPLSKLAARKQRELPAPRSAIRTLHPVQNLELAPASVKPSAKAAASDATRKEAELQTRVKAALVAPAVGAQLVVKLLRVAHACSASGSSQLPGDWRYDSRTRRGDASSRVLICPCGVKLRSVTAVERHLARGEAGCATRALIGGLSPALLSAPPTKLGAWQHKFDGGLTPSD
jgi:hypothetical protein